MTRPDRLSPILACLPVRRWWFEDTRRNIGIATSGNGPDVLDSDVHGDVSGFTAFERLDAAGRIPVAGAVIQTPSGGQHRYFAGSDQGNGTLARHHLDFRSRGGYVVAPPSVVDGQRYEVLAHGPVWMRCDWQAIRAYLDPRPLAPRQRMSGDETTLDRLAGFVERLETGNRNAGLYWAARRADKSGVLGADGMELLVRAAIRSGLGEAEARRTIVSAMRSRQGRSVT